MTTNIPGIGILAGQARNQATLLGYGKATYNVAKKYVSDNPTFMPDLPFPERVRIVQSSIGKMLADLRTLQQELDAGQDFLPGI